MFQIVNFMGFVCANYYYLRRYFYTLNQVFHFIRIICKVFFLKSFLPGSLLELLLHFQSVKRSLIR